jgi:hypothetical protein
MPVRVRVLAQHQFPLAVVRNPRLWRAVNLVCDFESTRQEEVHRQRDGDSNETHEQLIGRVGVVWELMTDCMAPAGERPKMIEQQRTHTAVSRY